MVVFAIASPSAHSHLCWWMCKPFTDGLALLGLQRSSVSFEWATLCLQLLFPAQREIASAGFCLLMGVFTFPRERHYSLVLMSTSTPCPSWERSLSWRVDRKRWPLEHAQLPLGQPSASVAACSLPQSRLSGGRVHTPGPACIMNNSFSKWAS